MGSSCCGKVTRHNLPGVRSIVWSPKDVLGRWTAWRVVASEPTVEQGVFTLRLSFAPSARLQITAEESAQFYEVDMPSLPEAPPDYVGDDDMTIVNDIPQWESVLRVINFSRLTIRRMGSD
jgi:hypothetical protein